MSFCRENSGLGGLIQSRPERPEDLSPFGELPIENGPRPSLRVAGFGCQTTAGNARITNEFLVSLGDQEPPANKGSGHWERLLGPPAGERP